MKKDPGYYPIGHYWTNNDLPEKFGEGPKTLIPEGWMPLPKKPLRELEGAYFQCGNHYHFY